MDYKPLYFQLFNAITNALDELSRRNYGVAAEVLKLAQRSVEEQYIENTGAEQ